MQGTLWFGMHLSFIVLVTGMYETDTNNAGNWALRPNCTTTTCCFFHQAQTQRQLKVLDMRHDIH